mgnify:FL=1
MTTTQQAWTDALEWRARLEYWAEHKHEAERLDGCVVRIDRPDDDIPRKRVAIVVKNWERETRD